MLSKLIFCFALTLLATDVSAINGGRWANLGEVPYQVALKNSAGRHFCSGAILKDRWILTLADCLEEWTKNQEGIIVQAGSRYLDGVTESKVQSLKVEEVVYFDEDLRNHVPVLLKLEESLSYNPLTQSIEVASEKEKYEESENVTFAGWGPTINDQSGQSNILKIAEKTVGHCDFEGSVCVSGNGGNACEKDLGSPVVAKRNGKSVVVALSEEISSAPCGNPNGWFKAVEMSKYHDEIRSIISGDQQNEGSNATKLPEPSTPFKRLPSEKAPIDLRIKGCTTDPCVLHAGSLVSAEWDFIVERNTSSFKPYIYAPQFEYDLSKYYTQDICKGLKNAKCPMSKGESATFGFKLPIYKALSNVQTDLHICFKDNEDYVVMCFAVGIDVREGESNEKDETESDGEGEEKRAEEREESEETTGDTFSCSAS